MQSRLSFSSFVLVFDKSRNLLATYIDLISILFLFPHFPDIGPNIIRNQKTRFLELIRIFFIWFLLTLILILTLPVVITGLGMLMFPKFLNFQVLLFIRFSIFISFVIALISILSFSSLIYKPTSRLFLLTFFFL